MMIRERVVMALVSLVAAFTLSACVRMVVKRQIPREEITQNQNTGHFPIWSILDQWKFLKA